MREAPLQAEAYRFVVGCRQIVGGIHQRRGEDDARCEAANAGNDILRQHRLAVVEPQTVAQGQAPHQPIILDAMPSNHLRLRLPFGVEAVERVENEIGGVARRPCGGHDRVKHTEIGNTDKAQRRRAFRPPNTRRESTRKRHRRGRLQQIAPSDHRHERYLEL